MKIWTVLACIGLLLGTDAQTATNRPLPSVDTLSGLTANSAFLAVDPSAYGQIGKLPSSTFSNSVHGIADDATRTAITNLNGLTNKTQSLAVGSAGTTPAWSSAASTHTLNLPLAAAHIHGILSSNDWTTFMAKADASFAVAISNQNYAASNAYWTAWGSLSSNAITAKLASNVWQSSWGALNTNSLTTKLESNANLGGWALISTNALATAGTNGTSGTNLDALYVGDLFLTNALPVVSGGTGRTNLTAGSLLVGDGTNAVALRATNTFASQSDLTGASNNIVGLITAGGTISVSSNKGSYVTATNLNFVGSTLITNQSGDVSIAIVSTGGQTNLVPVFDVTNLIVRGIMNITTLNVTALNATNTTFGNSNWFGGHAWVQTNLFVSNGIFVGGTNLYGALVSGTNDAYAYSRSVTNDSLARTNANSVIVADTFVGTSFQGPATGQGTLSVKGEISSETNGANYVRATNALTVGSTNVIEGLANLNGQSNQWALLTWVNSISNSVGTGDAAILQSSTNYANSVTNNTLARTNGTEFVRTNKITGSGIVSITQDGSGGVVVGASASGGSITVSNSGVYITNSATILDVRAGTNVVIESTNLGGGSVVFSINAAGATGGGSTQMVAAAVGTLTATNIVMDTNASGISGTITFKTTNTMPGSGSQPYIGMLNTTNLVLSNGMTMVVLGTNGKVGIGKITTVASYALDVVGGIGASGSIDAQNIYCVSDCQSGASGKFTFGSTRTKLSSPADGYFAVNNVALNDAIGIIIGTNGIAGAAAWTFPMIKKVNTAGTQKAALLIQSATNNAGADFAVWGELSVSNSITLGTNCDSTGPIGVTNGLSAIWNSNGVATYIRSSTVGSTASADTVLKVH